MSAEQTTRQTIDELLLQAGWVARTVSQAIHAARGVAIGDTCFATPHLKLPVDVNLCGLGRAASASMNHG